MTGITKPPTTFYLDGRVVTIVDRHAGQNLSQRDKEDLAYVLALSLSPHVLAIQANIDHGLALDEAEADALLADSEGRLW